MNKADEKRLKKDPRYQRIVAAKTALDERLAAAKAAFDAEVEGARKAYAEAAPEMGAKAVRDIAHRSLDAQVLTAIRPKGDTVRVERLGWLGRVESTGEAEIENVTATQVSLVGHEKPFRRGYRRLPGGTAYRIVDADLERIKAGELKGWRQKPWGAL